ncbi:Insertion element protein [Sporosarcina globispora]|uniref:Insertion element protein n=1 Tax=Sporosarcina globispora TaxID=1459 RepID=A0A0M0G6N5_SPOGL|nr:IS1595-like element ISSpgl1 family transposase [Sporosarcina globispora]KON85489.1 Insertion element protein [Sporosarcina globispora]
MWKSVYEEFSDLKKSEQMALFNAMKQDLFPDEPNKITKLLKRIREARFSGGLACVHCGCASVKRNGKYRTRQRYLCKDCGKSFNDMTHTPFSGSRYPEKWVKYIELMVEGYTLPKIAEKLKIHISTAFYWRHKVLNALSSIGFQELSGIVESDETFFKESMKGRKIFHREAKERGGRDSKRGISNLKIAVVVAQDRNGNVVARKAGNGRVKAEEIDVVLGDYIHPSALLCTDTATNYKKFAKIKGLQHETINERQKERVKKGIYHVQHVNNFHKRLKDWMDRFLGVATKYLDNYLYWFRWLEIGKKMAFENRVEQMLISACQKPNYYTVEKLRLL